jgi:quercetin dioxygenase-like cupin family protein
MAHTIIAMDELPHSGTAHRFEGYLHGGANVSFFISETPPGEGPRLHIHPYEEVFVVQEGVLTFTVGDAAVEATSGHIVVAPPACRTGSSIRAQARHIDIHTSGRMTTEWLEDERSGAREGGGSK